MSDYFQVTSGGIDHYFYEKPAEPLKGWGKVYSIGWDIPSHWAVDATNQCWASGGHGSVLSKVTPRQMFGEAADDPEAQAQMRKLLGMKPKLPAWVNQARAAGWVPPADWDESQYDPA